MSLRAKLENDTYTPFILNLEIYWQDEKEGAALEGPA